MIQYKNRYSDVFTFTLDDNGDILWEGNFEWSRFGMPNDYTAAYEKWHNDFPKTEMLSLEDFKQIVHQYDETTQEYKYKEYLELVKSDFSKINMVDPSGGPYLSVGQDMGVFNPDWRGMKIAEFERVDTGYKIIIKK